MGLQTYNEQKQRAHQPQQDNQNGRFAEGGEQLPLHPLASGRLPVVQLICCPTASWGVAQPSCRTAVSLIKYVGDRFDVEASLNPSEDSDECCQRASNTGKT